MDVRVRSTCTDRGDELVELACCDALSGRPYDVEPSRACRSPLPDCGHAGWPPPPQRNAAMPPLTLPLSEVDVGECDRPLEVRVRQLEVDLRRCVVDGGFERTAGGGWRRALRGAFEVAAHRPGAHVFFRWSAVAYEPTRQDGNRAPGDQRTRVSPVRLAHTSASPLEGSRRGVRAKGGSDSMVYLDCSAWAAGTRSGSASGSGWACRSRSPGSSGTNVLGIGAAAVVGAVLGGAIGLLIGEHGGDDRRRRGWRARCASLRRLWSSVRFVAARHASA